MSRRITKNISRFDGGITDNIRTSDLSKCANVSHFDIYRDPSRLYPMPGYIDDMDDGSTATGMKQYGIKAFFYDGTLTAVGTKSDGTGSKNFEKATPETASWSASTTGEGTYDLYDKTFLHVMSNDRRYYLTTNGGDTYITYYAGTVTDAGATFETSEITSYIRAEYAYNDSVYTNKDESDVVELLTTSISDPATNTAIRVKDIQSGDEQVGLFGHRFYPYTAQLLLWDGASILADRKIDFGKGRATCLGFIDGVWVGVVDENITGDNTIFNEEANGEYALSIKYPVGSGTNTLLRLKGETNTNGVVMPLRAKFRDSMLFYARIPADAVPTTYRQGIWAIGKARPDSPLAVSLLLDTGSLGLVEGYYSFGHHHYFAHNEDGSISRLDTPTGTYDVTAIYETLMFGYDTPYMKQFNGIAVTTEDLPASATITAKYRFDENDSWTTLGTSSTDGDEHHVFTKAGGISIGEFQEIQFRIEVLGNAPIKGIHISYTETDSLPFTL